MASSIWTMDEVANFRRTNTWPLSGDQFAVNVSLRLLLNGTNDSTTFTDTSVSPKTITRVGNTVHTNAQSKWYGTSALFDGTGDALSVPAGTDFDFGTGDFTIEMWVRTAVNSIQNGASRTLWRAGTNDNQFYLNVGTGRLVWGFNALTSTASISDGNWHHVTACRGSGTLRLFIDGVLDGSVGYSTSVNSGGTCFIGAFDSANGSLSGHMQDFRITKGVARYTANFTTPTQFGP
jgi:hypothetical protein